MKLLSFILFILLPFSGITQATFTGTVTDAATQQPVSGASVFLSNTSRGTVTNSKGAFELTIPQGKYELVISSIGYETFSQVLSSTEPKALRITLQPKAKKLETVVIEPFEKDGWEKWGLFFIENFIGTSAFARECQIKNTGAIKFRHSKKNNELTAIALEPLIVENKALGYTVKYQLETFSYNFKTHYFLYQGYPFFEPMKGGSGRQKRWEEKRREAYEGSIMHFMRSLYVNKTTEEGFEIRHLQKIPNVEKQRVKSIYASGTRNITQSNGVTVSNNTLVSDSSEYYNKILRQPDFFDKINPTLLTGDSIAYAVNNTTAGLDFNDYLLIIYKHKTTPVEFRKMFPESSTALASQVILINNEPVEVQANGSFYNPIDLMSLGYWAWSEKLSTMLPYDFVFSK